MSNQPSTSAIRIFHDSDLAGPLYLTVGFTALQLALTKLESPWWPKAQQGFGVLGTIALACAVWFTVVAARNLRDRIWEKQDKDRKLQEGFRQQLEQLQRLEERISHSAQALQGLQVQVESVAKSAQDLSDLVTKMKVSVQEVDEGIHRHIRNSNLLTGNNFSEVIGSISRMEGQVQKLVTMTSATKPTTEENVATEVLDPVPYVLYRTYSALAEKHRGVVYLPTFFNTFAALDHLTDWRLSGKDSWEFEGFEEGKPRSRWKDARARTLEMYFKLGSDGRSLQCWNTEVPLRDSALPDLDVKLEEALRLADFGTDANRIAAFCGRLGTQATSSRS